MDAKGATLATKLSFAKFGTGYLRFKENIRIMYDPGHTKVK